MRRVALTVDVEAHGFRAEKEHVARLIWGRQQGREQGIGKMMDIADRHGAALTFFVDYPEYELHGEDILDVAREIKRRGHDAEPHCHPEYLAKKLFGMDDPHAVRIGNATLKQATRMVEYMVDRHVRAIGSRPLAHRSRGYELSAPYLEALSGAGFALDASYSLSCKRDPPRLALRGPFRFSNGLLEIPVPFVPYFKNAGPLISWNFNQRCFLTSDIEENLRWHEAFLEAWFKRHGDDAVATLVMHSWSFWKMDSRGFFTIPDDAGVELFERLLAFLKTRYEIITLGKLAHRNEDIRCDPERVDVSLPVEHCPVCYEPATHFQYCASTSGRLCPFCKSVEQQRTLVDLVYAGAFGPQLFHNKDVLHIAPARSETLLLRRMHDCRVTTLNVQPGCDIQADVSSLPLVADNSFDVVLACGIFRQVRHLDTALMEIARVLRPGGLLLCSDCLHHADYGRENAAVEEPTAWYGRAKLKPYGIGTFRCFDRKDREKALEPYFYTRIFTADDKTTGAPSWWLVCTPKSDGIPRYAQPADPVIDSAILRSNAGRIFMDAAHDPLQKFLPDFHNWQQFRKLFTSCDLTWLKKNIFTLCFETFRPLPCKLSKSANFLSTYPTDFHPYEDQSFTYLLPELSQDNSYGDCRQLNHMVSEIDRWITTYGFSAQSNRMERHTYWMVWHDSATAIRLDFMAYILLRILPLASYPPPLIEKIFRSMLDHFHLLCADQFFSAHNNHGWLQMFGLLSFCRAMRQARGTTAAISIAAKRIFALTEKLLTPDGMLREHSPDYQAFCITLFASMRNMFPEDVDGAASSGIGALDRVLEKMRFCLRCVVRPDGELVPFGDTTVSLQSFPLIESEVALAASMSNSTPAVSVLRESGYATLRLRASDQIGNPSFLAMIGAFHSCTHKHCDDLSFVWSEGQQNILVDCGQQSSSSYMLYNGPLWEKGFYYSAPNCVYAESAHAHNVVEINSQTWSRRIKPYGVLPLHGRQLSERHWMLEGEWQRPEGFLQKRRLIFSPGRWLLVLDKLELRQPASPKPTEFTQWFHFAPPVELEDVKDQIAVYRLSADSLLHCQNFLPHTRLTCHKGEFSPRLQGWMADTTSTSLLPAWALGLHHKNTTASFCTLFSLIGPCRKGEFVENGCILHFAHENAESITWADTEPMTVLPYW